jgi:small multidrug resistance pump
MSPWTKLAFAIVVEVAATIALRQSDGLSNVGWSIGMVAGYLVSFYLLSQITGELEIGVIYAVWSAAGTAIVAVLGIALFHEGVSPLKIAGLVLIVGGVIALNIGGGGHDAASDGPPAVAAAD